MRLQSMAQQLDSNNKNKTFRLVTFQMVDSLYGIDVLIVKEINKLFDITPVPQSPEYIKGILNLRGQIVTIIDLSKKLGFLLTELRDEKCIIIVDSMGEDIGFLVEQINDVVQVDLEQVEPPPSNIGGVQGKLFKGVLKTENNLIGILDVEEVLNLKHDSLITNRSG